MTLSLTIRLWWAIPSLVTLVAFWWAHNKTKRDTSIFAGLNSLVYDGLALFVSLVAWFIGAICK